MRYTVIIPHYNTPELLRQAIASVPVRDDVEVLVSDDKEGRGAGWARNQMLPKAQGEWIMFLDADDLFTSEAFPAFDRMTEHTDADIIYFRLISTFVDTGELSNRDAHLNRLVDAYLQAPTPYNDNVLRYRFHEPVAKLIRRTMVMEHHLTFENVRWANDVRFSAEIGHYARSIAVAPDVVYDARVRYGSLVNQHSLDSRRCRYEVMLRHNQMLRQWGHPEMQESLMFSLRRAFAMGGIKALIEFIRLGRQYDADFLVGWQSWLKNAFNREEKQGKERYIVS